MAPPIRDDRYRYIDEQQVSPYGDTQASYTSSSSRSSLGDGSSVEEESISDTEQEHVANTANLDVRDASRQADDLIDQISPARSRLEDFAFLDRARQAYEPSEPSEEDDGDWDIGDEDWDLAHGDLTKQYNRLRQEHQAEHPELRSMPTRLGAPAAGPSRVPLPARNRVNTSTTKQGVNGKAATRNLNSSGVALNPKIKGDRQAKDKSDRATQDQVLDARTRLVLSGLINRGVIGELDRCISTGKEANVYYAQLSHNPPPSVTATALAVKIYRTSILNFRSRQVYITGEHRFQGEYSSSRNARKMVRVWAEKELRNLKRLEQFGLRAPRVIEGKENVLVMEYLGHDGAASPRLKDAMIPEEHLPRVYAELVISIRRMYQQCRLVHGDLSEYNVLYHDSHIYVIDVSQSVDHDHPKTFDFLRADIRNVTAFFRKESSGTFKMLGLRRMWDFVTRKDIGLREDDELGDQGEDRLFGVLGRWLEEEDTNEYDDDAVFMSSFIPRTLGELYDPERDAELVKSGKGKDLVYASLMEMPTPNEVETQAELDDAKVGSRHVDDPDIVSGAESDPGQKKSRGFRHEDKDAKKERKKAVKDEQRERRQSKMPKAEKQRLVKKSAGK